MVVVVCVCVYVCVILCVCVYMHIYSINDQQNSKPVHVHNAWHCYFVPGVIVLQHENNTMQHHSCYCIQNNYSMYCAK